MFKFKGIEKSFILYLVLVSIGSFSSLNATQIDSQSFTITPAAEGRQMVRTALPITPELLYLHHLLRISDGKEEITPGLRVLTWGWKDSTPPPYARCAMLSFPYTFENSAPVTFTIHSVSETVETDFKAPVRVDLKDDIIMIEYTSGLKLKLHLIAPAVPPAPIGSSPTRVDILESNPNFLWERYSLFDNQWDRVIEVRVDALGQVIVIAHILNEQMGNQYAPDLGWEVETDAPPATIRKGDNVKQVTNQPITHSFTTGEPCQLYLEGGAYRLEHPTASYHRLGEVTVVVDATNHLKYRYIRCRAEDKLPMQPFSWRQVEVVIAPSTMASVRPTLEYPHKLTVDWERWNDLYQIGKPLDLPEELASLLQYHHQAILRSVAVGDDWGNITAYSDDSPNGAAMGMNRLNHCPAIFDEAYRTGDEKLLEAAVQWCNNMYDQSIWWRYPQYGGTRYNNLIAMNQSTPETLRPYMWRSNGSVNFCTKGFLSFWYAFERTGDPRMQQALDAQLAYSYEFVHANQGECRNIGDVFDFVRLYQFTGRPNYLNDGMRLFRELTHKLGPDHLFSQGGQPIIPNPPFINDDEVGYRNPFAKSYIIGYALSGLPGLARAVPNEPHLRETIQAVADFQTQSQDPLGGWRYPHPRSSSLFMSQAMEHAWQLAQADRFLGAQESHLDAIERVLRQRIHGWKKTGKVFGGVTPWELASGKVKDNTDFYQLYSKPEDRDFTRDYREGKPNFGSSPPEGLVYFPDVLAFYLQHRSVDRLLKAPQDNEPLGQILARVADQSYTRSAEIPKSTYQTLGVKDSLPIFSQSLLDRLNFPLSWLNNRHKDFDQWKLEAQAKVMECWLSPPPTAPWNPIVISEQDRGTYIARKVVFNLTADSRVLGLMLVPKSPAPHPAVLLLHDHGGRFDIGKEKVIQPWDDRPERMQSAREWVDLYYGGRFLGDELAQRGYVCFSVDALNWSDRGGAGYEGQQALAGNLLHMGMSWAGLIAYEDQRAAAFLASQPEVDKNRIGAMGLSMGAFRTWQLAALSDHISAGAAICWMATVKGLMVEGNNQTRGQSAYSMTHPGLFRFLDYPDVASLACPKPMLFYAGDEDTLFPVPSVRDAFAKMRTVWDSQNAGDRLVTRLWNRQHVFDRDMQEEVFNWLDRQLLNR